MQQLNENEAGSFSVTPTVDTTQGANTIGIYLTPEGGGTTTTIGTAAGAAADTEITIAYDVSSLSAGIYEWEVIADAGGTNPIVVLPDDTTGRPLLARINEVRKY